MLLTVPQRKSKHTVELTEGFLQPPLTDGRQHDFRIRMATPRRGHSCRLGFQGLADFQIVVDFSVEDDDETAAGRVHGLMTCRREVNYRQATMCQPHARLGVVPYSSIVRTTVSDGPGHLLEPRLPCIPGYASL